MQPRFLAATTLPFIIASFETQRSTKTLVILTRPKEWSLWLFQHKDKAVSHGVWEYCDLSVPTPPALHPKPERPMLPEGDLTAKDKALKKICTDVASIISTSLLDEWIRVTDLTATLDMPEMKGGQVQEEFLVTANKVHETWATAELRKLLDLQETLRVTDSDLPTITALVTSLRQFLRIVKPQGSTFGTFGASLGIVDNSAPNTKANTTKEESNQKPQAKHNHPPGKCICPEEHWYTNCLYINPAARPAGWTPDPEIEAKFQKAKKNPRIAKQLQGAVERQSTKATSEPTTTPIAFDAQPHSDQHANSMAYMFQAFSAHHVPDSPYVNRWTHTRYGTADETLFAGANSVQISEWGHCHHTN
ncbi:hypothetical protein EK21DRAFT_105728 [Setomelanomma holmii]|uniref:Uncharacterized protein n=1 Tax=Setomelanomma holmii TaxID=210430 RepID=A0A9P4LFQ3_9PLEO|nr:hypothetical protein EK21DRAFT_105728 [Setomelanomma holmii]